MAGFFIASAYAEQAAAQTRQAYQMRGSRWEPWDGKKWELAKPGSGVLLLPGIQGLFEMPELDVFTDESQLHGQVNRGWRAKPKKVWWPAAVYAGNGKVWQETDRAFFHGLHPGHTGRWFWVDVDGKERFMDLRYSGVTEWPEHDPAREGWAQYGIEFVADNPFWQDAQDEWVSFSPGAEDNFWPDDTKDGWTVSPGFDLDNAVLRNRGDIEVTPVFCVIGPMENISIAINGERTSIPWSVPAGKWVAVNAGQYPWEFRLTDGGKATIPPFSAKDSDGQDRTRELGAFDPVVVPRGEEVPIDVSYQGSGDLIVNYRELYFRPY